MHTANFKQGILCISVASTLSLSFFALPVRPQPAFPTPQPNIASPTVPSDVAIPQGFPESSTNPIVFFDDYSWRTFIALVWPAQSAQRGAADTSKTIDGDGPRVFETYKQLFEVFHKDGTAPAAWNVYDPADPCGQHLNFGDFELSSFSKFGHLGEAGIGELVGPLVAQNSTYVMYSTGFNETEFNKIVNDKLYLQANLADGTVFPEGSIDTKSSWVDIQAVKHPERYYTRRAWIQDPQTGQCALKTVGLVGLHIVQKTKSRPQWIWSSFEHVDNVPPGEPGTDGFMLNNGNQSQSMPKGNPYPIDPLILPPPAPFNVVRLKQINDSTQQTNSLYRGALKKQNSIWQNYQLVMTQWPVVPNNVQGKGGGPKFTFPGIDGGKTSFANTTMETFDQSDVKTGGCMSCHDNARSQGDFIFSLVDHAFQPGAVTVPNKELKALSNFIKAGNKAHAKFIDQRNKQNNP
jgi:hypothetical protein